MSPTPIRPGKPVKPIKPIPGKPIIPPRIIKIFRSGNHFRTSILHSANQKFYEGADPGAYSIESKESGAREVAITMGLSLPPKLKLTYITFSYTTAGSSFIKSVGVVKNKVIGGYVLFYATDLNLQSSDLTEYKTPLLEQAVSETDGAINLSLNLRLAAMNERISIKTVMIEAVEVEE